MSITTSPVAACSTSEVVCALNRAFEQYVVPLRFTADGYERRFRSEHLDPTASHVVWHDAAPVGVILVARRGWTSRIAAVGIAPEYRRAGHVRRLLARALTEANARGDRRMLLEVITGNAPALALYEQAGFARRRRLVGYRAAAVSLRPEASGVAPIQECDVLQVARVVACEGDEDLPWHLAPETLAGLASPARAWQLAGRAFAVVADADAPTLTLASLVVRRADRHQGWATQLLRGLAARYPDRPWQVGPVAPERSDAGVFARLGWERHPVTQYEMELVLS